MTKRKPTLHKLKLDSIIGGGQTIGTLDSGKKMFVWGGLPDETVEAAVSKKKSSFEEGYVTQVIEASPIRIEPRDPDSYLSTSPWQIMEFASESHFKSALIEEAFELHNIVLPNPIATYTDGVEYGYRNKIEFSWWWSSDTNQLDLAFFKRGSKLRTPVEGTSLARPEINEAALRLRDVLRFRGAEARDLKTVIARSSQEGDVVLQLYVKKEDFTPLSAEELYEIEVEGFELIYSNPNSPASIISKRLQSAGQVSLVDSILGIDFKYAVEGFFQINLPVYEKALMDMKEYIDPSRKTIDLYSGVGSIGLTIGSKDLTLVELNEHAVSEMNQNISRLGRSNSTKAVLAASEKALDYIDGEANIIVDPPRAGLHKDVVERILQEEPKRIIYLSCNPVTQARDVALLSEKYGVKHHIGYNFFPRTPHIEHLVILDKK